MQNNNYYLMVVNIMRLDRGIKTLIHSSQKKIALFNFYRSFVTVINNFRCLYTYLYLSL